jgi:transcription-repair coupling factor (superfamily II helicase)
VQNQELISYSEVVRELSARENRIECLGFSGSERAYLISKLFRERQEPILAVTATSQQAEAIVEELQFYTGEAEPSILYFPPYNILPFKFLSYHNETAGRRISVLYRLLEATAPTIVVTTIEALLQKLVPRQEVSSYAELVLTGEEIERDYLLSKLVSGGYSQTAIVEEPGDFSVRGGIVDVFSPLYPDPLRMEFFGDFVESMRFFSASSQRQFQSVAEAVILPAREIILDRLRLADIISRIRVLANELEVPVTHVRHVIDQLKNEQLFSGIESLMPLMYPRLDTLFDYLRSGSMKVAFNYEELAAAARAAEERIARNYDTAREERRLCVAPPDLYLTWAQASGRLDKKKLLYFRMLDVQKAQDGPTDSGSRFSARIDDNSELSMSLRNQAAMTDLFQPLVAWIKQNKDAGYATVAVCRTESQAGRLTSLLEPYGLAISSVSGFPAMREARGQVYIGTGAVSKGFVWPAESLAIITDDEIFGVRQTRRTRPKARPRTHLLDMQELKQDDLIVHDDHGIGQYGGLVQLKIEGVTNDFLLLVYKGRDKLYLPVDRMGIVQKYMGVDGVVPVLDTLGGKSWEKVKARVKKSAEKIAGELLKLYARRKIEQGHAFGAPDDYIRDFEAGFAFEETEDQRIAIEDVVADMQHSTPMDRLVCGDVGYGKTEVALRAAFLAVNDGKQVAVLVPTTILAEQHYATFSSRFERYPINIACLSRFRAPSKQRAIVNDLKSGKIDIVVGTHRLLQKDIAFHDLGLLVLDEEQRFGVKHKEKLKQLRSAVDVLALTATPIPRTLHLSLVGVRDISIISTPPEYRKSIITYISEFDDGVITDAIRKELDRQGQIFFVHNHIQSIQKIADKLQALVPEVRLQVAHGRMEEDQLEEAMLSFMNRQIDMLVCTTIIESGLDIATANTIIVNRADRFGLAQMYQLRGRVGRSDEQAYAYLLIPHESLLSNEARKRLKVLMEHSDLGAGFQIAMSDLKIRGGGTILGASQSGHIAAVGYDMFLKLMENSIAELKGEETVQPLEPEINVRLSAHLSADYIPDIDQRMAAYRRLAKMTDLQQISDFKAELIDRFGALTDEAGNLLVKIILKVMAQKAGVSRLDMMNQKVVLHFSEPHQRNPTGIVDMITSAPKRFELSPDYVLKARLNSGDSGAQIAEAKNLLKEIAQRVNG